MERESKHIIGLCNELQELGIHIKPETMSLILQMQHLDYKNLTKGVDSAAEYEDLLSRINGRQ